MILGLHSPIMAGIDYESKNGKPHAVSSIIESGGYEDDEDQGDVLWYTGSCFVFAHLASLSTLCISISVCVCVCVCVRD